MESGGTTLFSFTSDTIIIIEQYSESMSKAMRRENEINLNREKEEVKNSKAIDMTVYTLGGKIQINRNYNGRIVFLRLPSVVALDKMSLPCRNFRG